MTSQHWTLYVAVGLLVFLTVLSYISGGWFGLIRQLVFIAVGALIGLGLRYLLRD